MKIDKRKLEIREETALKIVSTPKKKKGSMEVQNLVFNMNFPESSSRSRGKSTFNYIYCLQESKLEGDVQSFVKQIWGFRWVIFGCLEASGSRGGILVLWDSRSWKGEVINVGSYSITVKFDAQAYNFSWHLIGVYAPHCRPERRNVWWEVAASRRSFDGPWVVCGDFNVTRFMEERRDISIISRAMTEFSNFIENLELLDPPLLGGVFTWTRSNNSHIASRLDRFLFSFDWDESLGT
uniref:Uncharacterized protein LOC104221413 n=1 Tax=Nicotiana sylvestris TaxID=4096 RepID=A0A1U7W0Q7_NICSY|nr:PREDICTED: uncharacterized protein LOC104221413 [Nicotiana sylvestris]